MPRLVRSRPLFCRVVDLRDATPSIRIVLLEVLAGGPFRFAAGQYALVTFGEHRPRAFSLANQPDEPVLEVHIRHAADGGASRAIARDLRLGEGVWVEGPYGDAWLRPEHGGPILAIAGGTGLAPIKSIVGTALHRQPDRPVHVYHGARDESDVYLETYFRRLAALCPNFRYVPVLSVPCGVHRRRTGMVTDAVAEDFASFSGMKAYVAGPPPMVGAAVALLTSRGLARTDIHADGADALPVREAG